MKEDKRSTGMH